MSGVDDRRSPRRKQTNKIISIADEKFQTHEEGRCTAWGGATSEREVAAVTAQKRAHSISPAQPSLLITLSLKKLKSQRGTEKAHYHTNESYRMYIYSTHVSRLSKRGSATDWPRWTGGAPHAHLVVSFLGSLPCPKCNIHHTLQK